MRFQLDKKNKESLVYKPFFMKKSIGLILFFCLAVKSFGSSEIKANNKCKPWMLFVTQLIPPSGPAYSQPFAKACFDQLKSVFDTTSYQVVLIKEGQKPEDLSNNKKDIILSSELSEFWIKGSSVDTVIFWIRYRVGFTHSRVAVPYKRGEGKNIPALLAQNTLATVLSEFLCSISLTGGPPEICIKVVDEIKAYPPCSFYLPPGNYSFESSYPGFKNRIDSLSLFPGKAYSKRILLLPE